MNVTNITREGFLYDHIKNGMTERMANDIRYLRVCEDMPVEKIGKRYSLLWIKYQHYNDWYKFWGKLVCIVAASFFNEDPSNPNWRIARSYP